jgi:hypothetical protein
VIENVTVNDVYGGHRDQPSGWIRGSYFEIVKAVVTNLEIVFLYREKHCVEDVDYDPDHVGRTGRRRRIVDRYVHLDGMPNLLVHLVETASHEKAIEMPSVRDYDECGRHILAVDGVDLDQRSDLVRNVHHVVAVRYDLTVGR